MRTVTRSRRWVVVLAVLALGGIVTGGVVAAQLGPSTDITALQAAIERDPLVRVADLPGGGAGRERAVFLQLTSTGHLCLWDAPPDRPRERAGGCNPAADPFAGRAITASLAYDGGPALESVRDARLIGLASADVAAVHVVMSDGTVRQVALRGASLGEADYRIYAYRFRPSDLRRGLGPTAVVAVNDAGHEIGRQPTGFGG